MSRTLFTTVRRAALLAALALGTAAPLLAQGTGTVT